VENQVEMQVTVVKNSTCTMEVRWLREYPKKGGERKKRRYWARAFARGRQKGKVAVDGRGKGTALKRRRRMRI